ncbi:MAG TPA: TolC family outer membrane protein [Terracidiphilus sp.]|nr:TolC family outer membrane protein [Terracidiphilus sp.]
MSISPRARATASALIGLLALPGIPGIRAQTVTTLDLETAYRQAASSSPAIARAQAQLDADRAGRPLAKSALLPHVNATASGGMNTEKVTGFGAQTISTGYHSDLFTASLSQSIFNGQSLSAVKEADSRVRQSEAALASAQQAVALAVTQAYLGVLQAQANRRVAQQQSDLLETLDRRTRAMLKVGSGDIISVEEVQAQLDAARADLVTAGNAVETAKAQLQRLTHAPVGTLRDITSLEPIGPQPDALGPWLEMALKNQPLLQQARAAQDVAEDQAKYARRARWPTLTLSGSGQHAAGTLVAPVTINQVGASLNLSIPIYEGGSIRAAARQAGALSRARSADLEDAQDQLKLATETAFRDLENSVAVFRAAQQAVASAKVSLDATREGHEIGTRSIIDLLTANTSYATAQRNYYFALYAQLLDRTQLKAAVGVLTPLDIDALNALLNSGGGNTP